MYLSNHQIHSLTNVVNTDIPLENAAWHVDTLIGSCELGKSVKPSRHVWNARLPFDEHSLLSTCHRLVPEAGPEGAVTVPTVALSVVVAVQATCFSEDLTMLLGLIIPF